MRWRIFGTLILACQVHAQDVLDLGSLDSYRIGEENIPSGIGDDVIWLTKTDEGMNVALGSHVTSGLQAILEGCQTVDQDGCFQAIIGELQKAPVDTDRNEYLSDWVTMPDAMASIFVDLNGLHLSIASVLIASWKHQSGKRTVMPCMYLPDNMGTTAGEISAATATLSADGTAVATLTIVQPTTEPESGSLQVDGKELVITLQEDLWTGLATFLDRMFACREGKDFDTEHGIDSGDGRSVGGALCSALAFVRNSAVGGSFHEIAQIVGKGPAITLQQTDSPVYDALTKVLELTKPMAVYLFPPEESSKRAVGSDPAKSAESFGAVAFSLAYVFLAKHQSLDGKVSLELNELKWDGQSGGEDNSGDDEDGEDGEDDDDDDSSGDDAADDGDDDGEGGSGDCPPKETLQCGFSSEDESAKILEDCKAEITDGELICKPGEPHAGCACTGRMPIFINPTNDQAIEFQKEWTDIVDSGAGEEVGGEEPICADDQVAFDARLFESSDHHIYKQFCEKWKAHSFTTRMVNADGSFVSDNKRRERGRSRLRQFQSRVRRGTESDTNDGNVKITIQWEPSPDLNAQCSKTCDEAGGAVGNQCRKGWGDGPPKLAKYGSIDIKCGKLSFSTDSSGEPAEDTSGDDGSGSGDSDDSDGSEYYELTYTNGHIPRARSAWNCLWEGGVRVQPPDINHPNARTCSCTSENGRLILGEGKWGCAQESSGDPCGPCKPMELSCSAYYCDENEYIGHCDVCAPGYSPGPDDWTVRYDPEEYRGISRIKDDWECKESTGPDSGDIYPECHCNRKNDSEILTVQMETNDYKYDCDDSCGKCKPWEMKCRKEKCDGSWEDCAGCHPVS